MVATSYLTAVVYSLWRAFFVTQNSDQSSLHEGHLRSVQTYDPECYIQNGPMSASNVNQRYFNLFSPTPPSHGNAPPSAPSTDAMYACWTEKYSSYFASIKSKVGRNQMFSSFNPVTQEAVNELQQLIQDNISAHPDKIVTFLEYLKYRGDIQPQLLMHAIAGAEISSNSKVLAFLPTPALAEIFPTKFFSGSFDNEIVTKRGMVGSSSNGECVLVNEKWGKTNGIENRLWFWREDVALNMHHWTWHLHNPTKTNFTINRRGELFYFFHHDLLARYAAERMANGFENYFVEPIHPREGLEITQGYDSNLKDGVSSVEWVNRPNRTILRDKMLPPDLAGILAQHQVWWDRVANITSNNGYVKTNTGDAILIPDAINSIAELFESSVWALNRNYYGGAIGWHNMAHNMLGGMIVNETQRITNATGVLSDVSTAVRDIVFYRIHQSVNEMFMNYKHAILAPYELSQGEHPLILPGIVGRSISTQPSDTSHRAEGGCHNESLTGTNHLETCWKPRNMIIDGGLDFDYNGTNPNLKLHVCLKHLDHGEFIYDINLENELSSEQNVYVRIFMAPRYKVNGQRFTLEEQYPLFFIQDGFPVTLQRGKNTIRRKSVDSSTTAPWWKTKIEIQQQLTSLSAEPGDCTCGFPHHLLIPMGTENGSVYDLVAMVTDGKDFEIPTGAKCAGSWIHCGLPGNDYPDKKPMGYPWDRAVAPGFRSGKMLEDYVSQIPNMVMTQISVYHDDTEVKEHVEGAYNAPRGHSWREESY